VAPRNILLASDRSPLSDQAVRLGLVLGRLAGAHIHILGVVEYPLDRLMYMGVEDPATREYHRRIRAAAERGMHSQVQRSQEQTSPPVTVHTAEGAGIPDLAILRFIEEHGIDLLVLGTAARHGLAGAVIGNTAERLLPQVPCSVLAVKLADFRCSLKAEGG
jgi:universal stress protein E